MADVVDAVPAVDEGQLLRLQFANDDVTPGTHSGRPVAVIVLQDGTELHFFQFIDSEESSDNDDER